MNRIRFTPIIEDIESARFDNIPKNKKTDINILLNRIKVEENKTTKKKFTLCALAIFTVCLVGTLIS